MRQSCLTLCDPIDCSLPGYSVHGILQARILEWVAIPFSEGTFSTQGSNPGLLPGKQILNRLSYHPCRAQIPGKVPGSGLFRLTSGFEMRTWLKDRTKDKAQEAPFAAQQERRGPEGCQAPCNPAPGGSVPPGPPRAQLPSWVGGSEGHGGLHWREKGHTELQREKPRRRQFTAHGGHGLIWEARKGNNINGYNLQRGHRPPTPSLQDHHAEVRGKDGWGQASFFSNQHLAK